MKLYPDSVIRKTSQWWKLIFGFWLMAAGGVLILLVGCILRIDKSNNLFSIGVLLAVIGIFILFLTIRCPKCGAKWFWMAVSKRGIDKKWGMGVLSLAACPECKATHNIGVEQTPIK